MQIGKGEGAQLCSIHGKAWGVHVEEEEGEAGEGAELPQGGLHPKPEPGRECAKKLKVATKPGAADARVRREGGPGAAAHQVPVGALGLGQHGEGNGSGAVVELDGAAVEDREELGVRGLSSTDPYLAFPNRDTTLATLIAHYLAWRLHLPYLACSSHCLI